MKKSVSQAELRRKARRKKIVKRRLLIITFLLIIIGVAVLCILLKTKLFPVKKITAEGSDLYTSAEIISASGIRSTTPIMSISEDEIKSRISKKLSYIETVKIKKRFPDTVYITVEDAEEYYAFKTDDGYFAASKSRRVLNFYSEIPENTVEVSANSLKMKKGETVVFETEAERELFEFLTSYAEKKGIELNSIDITDSIHIGLRVEDRFEVNLGNKEHLKEKIDHLCGMISEIGDRKGRINLEMWSNSDSKGTFIAEN